MDACACGHTAWPGPHLMCRHLMGESGEEHDFVRLLTGRGMAYDLCCQGCDEARSAGTPPELLEACEGCVERIDDSGERAMAGWRGEAEVLERPEPVDTTVLRTRLSWRVRDPLDLAPVAGADGSVWLILTFDDRIVRFDAGTGTEKDLGRVKLPKEKGAKPLRDGRKKRRLHASARGDFAAVVNDYGRHGLVIDLATGKTALTLDGGDYRPDTVPFSLAFAEHDGRTVVVHRTDWNRLDVSDPATGELLTERPTPANGEPHHMDYFHGALHISPDGRWIAGDGWVWAPVGVPQVWDLRAWLAGDRWASEDAGSLCDRDYHWDAPMAWVGDGAFALGGIGHDDLYLLDGARVFDAETREEVSTFPGPRGALFGDRRRLYSAGPDGLEIWDPFTGERTGAVPGFVPVSHHPGAGELAVVKGRDLLRWRTR